MTKKELSRRALLSGGALWALAGLPVSPVLAARKKGRKRRNRKKKRKRLEPVPRVNGAINIQPIRRFGPEQEPKNIDIIPKIVDLQMRALYELGFESIRLTLSFSNLGVNLLGAIPYVRAARALGIEVLGLMGQFGFNHNLVQKFSDPANRDTLLGGYVQLYNRPVAAAAPGIKPGRFVLQFLNEPANFIGITAAEYVRFFLAPAYEGLKRIDPELLVLSAAPIGSLAGVARAVQMFEAGVENFCDRVALHVYNRDIIPELARLPTKPVWITETGVEGPENHLAWVLEAYPEIQATIPNVERIFFFELFDLAPRAFRILEIAELDAGSREIFSAVESHDLHSYLTAEVTAATNGAARAPYEEIIPDIMAYWPTDRDRELVSILDNL